MAMGGGKRERRVLGCQQCPLRRVEEVWKASSREGSQRHCLALTAHLPTGSVSTLGCTRIWWAHIHLGHTAWWPCL